MSASSNSTVLQRGRKDREREGRKKEEIEGEREREKSLVSKVLTENINSTKSTKRAFFPLRMKKNTAA